jgi:hypothetical protein
MEAILPLCLLLFVAIPLYAVAIALRDIAKAIRGLK